MAQAVLERTIELVKQLEPSDLRAVRDAVDKRMREVDDPEALERFHRAILEAGLVKEIKSPPYRTESERPMFPYTGEPLSETLVEDRG